MTAMNKSSANCCSVEVIYLDDDVECIWILLNYTLRSCSALLIIQFHLIWILFEAKYLRDWSDINHTGSSVKYFMLNSQYYKIELMLYKFVNCLIRLREMSWDAVGVNVGTVCPCDNILRYKSICCFLHNMNSYGMMNRNISRKAKS